MRQGPITVDPAKIATKIGFHQSEASRLQLLLETVESLREFSAEPKAEPKARDRRGRPTKPNAFSDKLRQFVASQSGEFTSTEIKDAVGKPPHRGLMRDAIRALESEGVLKTIVKPNGRRLGKYRRVSE